MANLAARCTACGTVFRVVPDQLRVAGGFVRCGRCSEVFNASESLVDMEAPAPAPSWPPPSEPVFSRINTPTPRPEPGTDFELDLPMPDAASAPGTMQVQQLEATPSALHPPHQTFESHEPFEHPAPFAPPQPVISEPAWAEADLRIEPGLFDAQEPRPSHDEPAADAPGSGLSEAFSDAPASSSQAPAAEPAASTDDIGSAALADASTTLAMPDAAAGPDRPETSTTPGMAKAAEAAAVPSFVRKADQAQRWRSPRVRAALGTGLALGLLLLAGQYVYTFRDTLAARHPGLRTLLEPACAALACRIEPPHLIDSLVVESSGLVRVEKSAVYKLQVALRNRDTLAVAVPALDVTLSDAQGKPLARRVLRLAELGVTDTTVAAGRELTLQATLQAAFQPASAVVAGYTIELFYP